MRRVRHARKDLTPKQLRGFTIVDNFRSLTEFCNRSLWSEAVRKHNAPAIDFHVSLYEYVVIGYELIAERDVVRINLSSVWMLGNDVRAIIAGWNFQLCADVTGNFCNRNVDLFEFSVTSIPCQNNVLCLSIIPKATESETVYKLSHDDLRKVVNYLCKIQPCGSADCECCILIRELLCEKNIVDFIASSEFKQQKVPVQTAKSDNSQGFCNFCRAEFGIDPILCKPHATGKALCCICRLCLFLILSPLGIAALQYSHVTFRTKMRTTSITISLSIYVTSG